MWDMGIYGDCTICQMNEVTLFWNTHFFNSNGRCEVQVSTLVVCLDGKDLDFEIEKNSYDKNGQVEFSLNGPNKK